MNEQVGKPGTVDDYEIWSFPELTHEKAIEALQIEELASDINAELDSAAAEQQQAVAFSEETERLNQELHQLTELFDQLNQELQQLTQALDRHLIEKIASLIKDTVKKIIGRDLRQAPQLFIQRIEKQLTDISKSKKTDPCSLFLSLQGYEIWQQHGFNYEYVSVGVDNQLQLCEYRLITPHNEVLVDIDRMLHAIFELDHESDNVS